MHPAMIALALFLLRSIPPHVTHNKHTVVLSIPHHLNLLVKTKMKFFLGHCPLYRHHPLSIMFINPKLLILIGMKKNTQRGIFHDDNDYATAEPFSPNEANEPIASIQGKKKPRKKTSSKGTQKKECQDCDYNCFVLVLIVFCLMAFLSYFMFADAKRIQIHSKRAPNIGKELHVCVRGPYHWHRPEGFFILDKSAHSIQQECCQGQQEP